MESNYKLIKDPESFEAFQVLLQSCNLPADDLNYNRDLLVGYYEDESMVGTGGLEVHGPYALLRSLSVKFGIRGKAVGSSITQFLLDEAKKKKLKAVYLLTETARSFFLRKGFQDVPRDNVPEEVKASSEFAHVCPTSASVMCINVS